MVTIGNFGNFFPGKSEISFLIFGKHVTVLKCAALNWHLYEENMDFLEKLKVTWF